MRGRARDDERLDMTMNIRPFETRDAAAWDAVVDAAPNATFLHSRRFLAYHGARFVDASLIVEGEQGPAAVFPAALDPADAAHVISHPGATYGGLIAPKLTASATIETLLAIGKHYKTQGRTRLTYKTVPHHLTALPSQADRYALWRLGATMTRRDLWSVIWSHETSETTSRLKRQLKIAERAALDVGVDDSDAGYRAYHEMLCANLEERHGVKPVHTADELIELRDRLGSDVALWLARQPGTQVPLAGVWLFRHGKTAWHTQYIASSPAGRELRAMHILLQRLLDEARANGIGALSYGAVTEQDGRVLNPGLEQFKVEFGGGLVIHDFFTLSLADLAEPA